MKKFTIITLALSLLALGCSKQDLQVAQEENPQQESVVVENPIQFVAKADESGETKTALNGTAVEWKGTESVTIFGTTKSGGTTVTSGVYNVSGTGASANLTYSSGTQFAQEDSPTYAVYPSGTSTDGTNITFTLPSTQTYAANSFADGANVSVGAVTKGSDDKYTITFKNVCSYLNLKLSVNEGHCAYVGKIVLKSKGGVKISGDCTVNASGDAPTATCSGDTTITLNCSSYTDPDTGKKGVALSSTTATSFYFVVPATTFGFTAEVYSIQGHLIKTLDTKATTVQFNRNNVRPIANQTLDWIPSSYQELAYLESTAHQYINTGYTPTTANLTFESTFTARNNTTTEIRGNYFGITNTNRDTGWWTCFNQDYNTNLSFWIGTGSGFDNSVFPANDTETFHHCIFSSSSSTFSISVDNSPVITDKSYSGSFLSSPSSFYLFTTGGSYSMITERMAPFKMKQSKLWADNTLIFNLVPVYSSAGESGHQYGMYDVLNDEFYTNAYTGTGACDFSGEAI